MIEKITSIVGLLANLAALVETGKHWLDRSRRGRTKNPSGSLAAADGSDDDCKGSH